MHIIEGTVEVTQDDIDEGIRQSVHWCPVALAVRRWYEDQGRNLPNVRVIGSEAIRINDVVYHEKGRKQKVSAFVDTFDRSVPVRPFTFDMYINDEYLEGYNEDEELEEE